MSQKGLNVRQWEGIGLDPALPVRLTSDTKDEGREEEGLRGRNGGGEEREREDVRREREEGGKGGGEGEDVGQTGRRERRRLDPRTV